MSVPLDSENSPEHPIGDSASPDIGQLDRIETRQVRLVISIPALMFLYTLISSVLIHLNLVAVADSLSDAESLSALSARSRSLLHELAPKRRE